MNTDLLFRFRSAFLRALSGAAVFLALSASPAAGQVVPQCFQLYFPIVEAGAGDTVCLPLRSRDFEMIASMQFAIYYDASAFDFVKIQPGTPLIGYGPTNYNVISPGLILNSWYDQSAASVTLSDTEVLFYLCLKVKNNVASGFYPLLIGETPSLPYEVKKMVLVPPNWVFLDLPLVQQQGGVSVGIPAPAGDLAVSGACVSKAVCGAPVGSISLDVTGGQPPYQYLWSGPDGFSAFTEDLDGLKQGVYSLVATDQNGMTISVQVNVGAINSGITIQQYLKPAFCGQPNGCATLELSGGHIPFTYAWSAGGSQTNENCSLPPGKHTVSVTDGTGCLQIDTFTIENDTLFQIDMDVQQIYDCNGAGKVTLTPQQDGIFTYVWSNGAAEATVDSLPAGVYEVTVTATAGGCSAVAYPWIVDYSTVFWNLQLLTTCNDPAAVPTGNLALRFNKNGGIAFPAIVGWSDGTTRLIPEKPSGNILDSLSGAASGLYSVTVTDAEGCTLSVQKVLNCAPPLPVPDSATVFYIQDDYLTPQYAVDSCAGVYARYFEDVASLQMELQYDPSRMGFKQIKLPGNPLYLSVGGNFNAGTPGSIKFSWSDPASAGVTLPANSLLFEVCFTPKNSNAYSNLKFADGYLSNYPHYNAFLGKNGYVLFGPYFPPGPSVCEYAAEPPSCASDGYGRILLGGCNPDDLLTGHYWHDGVYYDDLSGLAFAEAGKYEIVASQTAQTSNSLFANIPDPADPQPCVWPGDADDNNAVNHHDLLYLGLAYGTTGVPRPSASLEWLGQDAPLWPQATAVRKVNYKNMDANGDGLIDAADTMAIVQNWGRVVNPARDDPFNAPLGNPTGNTQLPFTIQADTLAPGQTAALPLLFGSQNTPADSAYGLAFSISYDPRKVKSNIHFKPSDSWLGETSQMLWLQKNFPGQARLDVAITRTDGIPVSGWGPIGDVFVIIEDDIFFGPGNNPDADSNADTVAKTTLFFSGLSSLHPDEAPLPLDAPPVELVILKTTTSAPETSPRTPRVLVFPNPASAEVSISCPGAGIQRVEFMNPTGIVLAVREANHVNAVTLDVRNFPLGTCFARVFTDKGVALEKIEIVR